MSFIGISNNIWVGSPGTGGGNPFGWVLAPGAVRATLDIDFVHGLAFNGTANVSPSSLLSCSRATPATAYYTNADGTLTTFAANTLRTGSNGLLVEEARDNIVTFSNDFSNGAWGSISGGTFTPTQNVTGPDGITNSAWSIQLNGASAGMGNNIGGVWAGSGISSIYLRAKSGTISGTLAAEGNDNADDNPIVLTTTWQRFTSTGISANTNGKSRFFVLKLPLLSLFEAFGGQLEAAAFATSYIPTTTVSVTRAADAVTFIGTAASTLVGLTNVPGTLFLAEKRIATGIASAVYLYDFAGVASNRPVFYTEIPPNGIGQFDGTNTGAVLTVTDSVTVFQKVARGWSGVATRGCPNGGGIVVGVWDGDWNATTPTLGSGNTSSQYADAYIGRIAAWNSLLSDANMQIVTT